MDLVTHPGVDAGAYVAQPGTPQAVGHVVGALTVVGHRVLVAGQHQHRQVPGQRLDPGGVVGLGVEDGEVPGEAQGHGGAEVVEGVHGVVLDDPAVQGHPVGGAAHVVKAVQGTGEGGPEEAVVIQRLSPSLGDGGLQGAQQGGVLQAPHLGGDTAQHQARQALGVARRQDPGDHGAPGVAEQDVGEPLEAPGDDLTQVLLVCHDDVGPVLARVLPHARDHGGAPVAGVVVGGHHEAGVEQGGNEVEVAARVLAQAVDDLDDTARGGGRGVDPRLDLVAVVG